jgi:hypothetical protein
MTAPMVVVVIMRRRRRLVGVVEDSVGVATFSCVCLVRAAALHEARAAWFRLECDLQCSRSCSCVCARAPSLCELRALARVLNHTLGAGLSPGRALPEASQQQQ